MLLHKKISIIMPVYNAECYIQECLNSIISQSLNDFELVCIDDCSTDNSLSILREYSLRDDRLRIIQMNKNSGSGPCRNRGIAVSKGKYITFMDADDLYADQNALQILYEAAEKDNDIFMVGGNLFEFYDNDFKSAKNWGRASFDKNRLYDVIEYPYSTGYTRFIYDREWLLENNLFFPDLRRYQDPVWFTQVLLASGKFYGINLPFYLRRVNHQKIKWDNEKLQHTLVGMKLNINCFINNNFIPHYKNEQKAVQGFIVSILRLQSEYLDHRTKLKFMYFIMREHGVCLAMRYACQIALYKLKKIICCVF
jgi:glycosyltransferase involved in cell wall biosynthesis